MFCAYIEKKVHVFDNLIVNNRERFTASKHKRKSNIQAVNTTGVKTIRATKSVLFLAVF